MKKDRYIYPIVDDSDTEPDTLPDDRAIQRERELEPINIDIHVRSIPREGRGINQDSYYCDQTSEIFGVFDGVGGNEGGEKASRAGVEMLQSLTPNIKAQKDIEGLQNLVSLSLQTIHRRIYEINVNNSENSASTGTIVAFLESSESDRKVVVGSIGDSRAYLYDGKSGSLSLITQDDDYLTYSSQFRTEKIAAIRHKLDNAITDSDFSQFSDEEINVFRSRNQIFQALGSSDEGKPVVLRPHVYSLTMHAGDKLVLTSDGIHDNLAHREIEQILSRQGDLAEKLIDCAQERSKQSKQNYPRSKKDDMTAMVIELN